MKIDIQESEVMTTKKVVGTQITAELYEKLKIESERLILRRWNLEDADALVDGLNNINVTKWMSHTPYPYTKQDAIDFITKDELVDALNEGIRTKNVDKLQMLLDQENLNRKKDKLKKREESKKELDDEEYEPHHSTDDYDE